MSLWDWGASWTAKTAGTGARLDGASTLMAFAGDMSFRTALQREMRQLKPKITTLLRSKTGVLLALRADQVGNNEVAIPHLQYLNIVGADNWPEALADKDMKRPKMFPKSNGFGSTVQYIWVIPRAKVQSYLHRPPGYYAQTTADIKFMAFEDM